MEISVIPKIVTPSFTIDKLKIQSMIVTPYVNATLFVEIRFSDPSNFLTEDKRYKYETIVLSAEEYDGWTTDDYLINLVLSKLQFTKA